MSAQHLDNSLAATEGAVEVFTVNKMTRLVSSRRHQQEHLGILQGGGCPISHHIQIKKASAGLC